MLLNSFIKSRKKRKNKILKFDKVKNIDHDKKNKNLKKLTPIEKLDDFAGGKSENASLFFKNRVH